MLFNFLFLTYFLLLITPSKEAITIIDNGE